MRGLSTKIFSLTILVCSLIILPLLNVSAQHFSIETFTTRDGLSHNDVRSISTDSSGFLWIATWDGLCRYDGYSFKNYYHYPDDSLSLPYFSITDVLVDGGNNIWIKTDAGSVARYDYTRDAFKRIELVEKNLPKVYTSISIDRSEERRVG